MATFTYIVTVNTDTADRALQVMAERIYPDEDYGFDYRIDFAETTDQPGVSFDAAAP